MLLGLVEGDSARSGNKVQRQSEHIKGHTACLGLPPFSGHEKPLRREPASSVCNRAPHSSLQGYSILKTPHTAPYNSPLELHSFSLVDLDHLGVWSTQGMYEGHRQIGVYFRGPRGHTHIQPASRCHTTLQLQTVITVKTQTRMEKA